MVKKTESDGEHSSCCQMFPPWGDVSVMSVSFCVPGSPVEKKNNNKKNSLGDTALTSYYVMVSLQFFFHSGNITSSTLHCGIQYSWCVVGLYAAHFSKVGQSMHIQYSAQYKTLQT